MHTSARWWAAALLSRSSRSCVRRSKKPFSRSPEAADELARSRSCPRTHRIPRFAALARLRRSDRRLSSDVLRALRSAVRATECRRGELHDARLRRLRDRRRYALPIRCRHRSRARTSVGAFPPHPAGLRRRALRRAHLDRGALWDADRARRRTRRACLYADRSDRRPVAARRALRVRRRGAVRGDRNLDRLLDLGTSRRSNRNRAQPIARLRWRPLDAAVGSSQFRATDFAISADAPVRGSALERDWRWSRRTRARRFGALHRCLRVPRRHRLPSRRTKALRLAKLVCEFVRGAETLLEGADGVEFARRFGPAGNAIRNPECTDRHEQRIVGFLTGGDHHGIGLDRARRAAGGAHADAARNDGLIRNVRQRLNSRGAQRAQDRPARRLTDPVPDRRTAAHERNALAAGHDQRAVIRRGQALLVKKARAFVDIRLAEAQIVCEVGADTARADDRDTLADRAIAKKNVGIRNDVREVASRQRDSPRRDTGRDYGAIEPAECAGILDPSIEAHGNAQTRELVGEVANRFVEVALSRNPSSHSKLAAELALRFEELDAMAERGEGACALHAGGSAADHGKSSPPLRRAPFFGELALAAGARVHHARD